MRHTFKFRISIDLGLSVKSVVPQVTRERVNDQNYTFKVHQS